MTANDNSWGECKFPINDSVNILDSSIQSLTSRKEYNLNMTKENSVTFQKNILNHNSLIDSLKESIRSNVNILKKRKVNHKKEDIINLTGTTYSKIKTEKEKIMEYYKNLKSQSKLNLSSGNSINNSILNENNYYSSTFVTKDAEQIKPNNDEYVSSSENEFLIFDCFKNMMKKNSKFEKNCNIISKKQDTYKNDNYSISVSESAGLDNINLNTGSNVNLFYSQNHNNIYNVDSGAINSLKNNTCNITNEYREEFENSEIINFDENDFDRNLDIIIKVEKDQSPFEYIKNGKYENSHNKFYKKKYNFFKKSSEEFKKKYIKEKKISEMLNLRNFYESTKISNQYLATNTNSDKNNLTSVSKTEEETKFTNLLCDKLQDNNILFEQLENEILNKDILINKQNDTITHQKQMIDRLLEQFNIFLNQGNYLINDLLILKQSMYEKNFKEVTNEFDVISSNINEYTDNIKDFSDRTKNIINEDDKYCICSKEISNKDKLLPILNTIDELHSEINENDSSLSFSLTKSNIKYSISMNTTNNDKSLKLLDLSHKEEDFLLN